ncbi:MAG: hypothetical protein V3T30_03950, partial [Thermodesulfobacteriota bacterium]
TTSLYSGAPEAALLMGVLDNPASDAAFISTIAGSAEGSGFAGHVAGLTDITGGNNLSASAAMVFLRSNGSGGNVAGLITSDDIGGVVFPEISMWEAAGTFGATDVATVGPDASLWQTSADGLSTVSVVDGTAAGLWGSFATESTGGYSAIGAAYSSATGAFSDDYGYWVNTASDAASTSGVFLTSEKLGTFSGSLYGVDTSVGTWQAEELAFSGTVDGAFLTGSGTLVKGLMGGTGDLGSDVLFMGEYSDPGESALFTADIQGGTADGTVFSGEMTGTFNDGAVDSSVAALYIGPDGEAGYITGDLTGETYEDQEVWLSESGGLTTVEMGTTSVDGADLYSGSPFIDTALDSFSAGGSVDVALDITTTAISGEQWGIWSGTGSGSLSIDGPPSDDWFAVSGGLLGVDVELNWVVPDGLSYAPDVDVNGNTITMGTPGANYQAMTYHGASAELPAAILGYSIEVDYNLMTNDAYSVAEGWWDSFSVSLSDEELWSYELTDPLNEDANLQVGFLWGGTAYSDETTESIVGSETLFMTAPSGAHYLNVYLDTATAPYADTGYGSWGEITINSVTALGGFSILEVTGSKFSDGIAAATIEGSAISAYDIKLYSGNLYGTYDESGEWITAASGAWRIEPLSALAVVGGEAKYYDPFEAEYKMQFVLGTVGSLDDTAEAFVAGEIDHVASSNHNSVFAEEITSFNANDNSATTLEGGAYTGMIVGTDLATSTERGEVDVRLGAIAVTEDGEAGILVGDLSGHSYYEAGLIGASGTTDFIALDSGISIDPALLSSEYVDYGDGLVSSSSLDGSFGAGGTLTVPTDVYTEGGVANWQRIAYTGGEGPATWGVMGGLMGGNFAGATSDDWVVRSGRTLYDSAGSEMFETETRGSEWDELTGRVSGTTFAYGAFADSDVENGTWIAVGETLGNFNSEALSQYEAVTIGSWLETSRFIQMAQSIDGRSALASLRIPFIEVGRVNLEGHIANIDVYMNDVTYFTHPSNPDASPELWGSLDVTGAYNPNAQLPTLGTTVPLSATSGGNVNADFTFRQFDAGGGGTNSWLSTIENGAGTLTGGSYEGGVNFEGAAAGSIDTGTGTFSGTAGGIAGP